MKICIINSFYYPDIVGGAELSVLKLAETLYELGNEVHVICTSNLERDEVINGVIIHRIVVNNSYTPMKMLGPYRNLNKFKRILYRIVDIYNIFNYKLLFQKLSEIKPDVIHINNIDGISSVIWSVCKKMRIPAVQTLRDYSLLDSKHFIKNVIRKAIYLKLSNNINVVTAPSKYTLNRFVEKRYFEKSEKRVVYNAIDFSESEVNKLLQKKKKDLIKKKNIKFVFLGRLEKEKGIDILLESFRRIDNNMIELLIAGKGEYEEFVKNIAKEDKRVVYKGFLSEEEKNSLLMSSDVLIIPSNWPEPFGRVIIEAYKFGLPVIGTNIGGIPEVIDNNITGLLVEANNKEQLSEAIDYFCESDNILNLLDNIINELKKYEIKNQCITFIDIYKSIVESK